MATAVAQFQVSDSGQVAGAGIRLPDPADHQLAQSRSLELRQLDLLREIVVPGFVGGPDSDQDQGQGSSSARPPRAMTKEVVMKDSTSLRPLATASAPGGVDVMSPAQTFLLWLGVVAPILRHVVIYSLGAAMPGYSARTDYISEIGALQAPYGLVMNVVGTGLVGLMMIVASRPMSRRLSPLRGGRLSAALIGISGIAFLGVAIFPCNPGCDLTPFGPRMALHVAAGLIAMAAEVAAPLAFGMAQFRQPSARGLGRAALVLGVVGVAAYALLNAGTGVLGVGLVQRIVQGAGDAWLLVAALSCLRGTR